MKAATCGEKTDINAHIFQSTPPVKAATDKPDTKDKLGGEFQSTPPVKAATQRETPHIIAREISIHAAREGGDVYLTHG